MLCTNAVNHPTRIPPRTDKSSVGVIPITDFNIPLFEPSDTSPNSPANFQGSNNTTASPAEFVDGINRALIVTSIAAKQTNPATAATPFDALANPNATDVAKSKPKLAKTMFPIDCKIVKNWNAPSPQPLFLAAAAKPPPIPKKIPAIGKIAIGKTITRARFCNLEYDPSLNLFQPFPKVVLLNFSFLSALRARCASLACNFSCETTFVPAIN